MKKKRKSVKGLQVTLQNANENRGCMKEVTKKKKWGGSTVEGEYKEIAKIITEYEDKEERLELIERKTCNRFQGA